MPGAAYIVSNMLPTSARTSASTFSTGEEICRRRGSGTSTMGRMAMRFNMAETGRFSTGRRLPKLDRIALGIVNSRKPADARVVPLVFRDHLDAGIAQFRQQLIEIAHPEIDHPLPV